MSDSASPHGSGPPLSRGALVRPADDLASVQSPTGELVPVEKLGSGIVAEAGPDGRALVHWTGAGFDAWMEPEEVRVAGRDARLITVNQCDKQGQVKLLRRRIMVAGAFAHSWTVELRPGNLVRALRDDNCSWIFRYNPIFRRLSTDAWSVPPEDDDAEALTAAELGVFAAR